MVDNADKGAAASPEAGNGAAAATTPDVQKIEAALKAEQEARAAAEARAAQASRNYDNLRGAYGKQSQLVGKYRSAYGDFDAGAGEVDMPRADVVSDQVTIDPNEANIALVKFRQEHTDWNASQGEGKPTISQDIDALLASPRGAEFVAVKVAANGQVVMDVERTLRAAYREIKLNRYELANAEARKAQEAAEAKTNKMRNAGFVSGGSVVDVAEDLDIANMSADEFAQKVLAPAGLIDEKDPVRSQRGLRRR